MSGLLPLSLVGKWGARGLGARRRLSRGWERWQGQRRGERQAGPLTMAGTRAPWMLENFIDGKFLPCNSYLDSYDPSTGDVYCRVPNSGKEEVSISAQRRWMRLASWWLNFPGAEGSEKRGRSGQNELEILVLRRLIRNWVCIIHGTNLRFLYAEADPNLGSLTCSHISQTRLKGGLVKCIICKSHQYYQALSFLY